MKNLYNTIKETAKKYTLPLAVAGGLVLGSCSQNYELPLKDSVKDSLVLEQNKKYSRQLDSLVSDAEKNVYLARESFNEGVSKRNLDSLALTNTLASYQKAETLYEQSSEFAREKGLENYVDVGMSKEDKHLMKRHDEVLNGIDYGKAELQKDLEKQGLEVEVYNPDNESDPTFWTIIGGAFLGVVLSHYLIKKRSE